MAVLVLGASGVFSSFVFSTQTPLKWLLTIVAPVLIVGLFVVSEPTILLMAVTILMSPFAPYVVQCGQLSILSSL